MKKGYVLLVFCLVFAFAFAACQPTATEAPTAAEPAAEGAPAEEAAEQCVVKVGVPSILTGSGASMGEDIKAGAELATKKINEEGGVLGCRIELVFADVKNETAEDCALAAQTMDQANVVAYFPGAFFGTTCIQEFATREPILMHHSASADMVSVVVEGMPESNNVFMTCEDEYSYGPNAFDVIVNVIGQEYEFPNNKVALLGGNITYDMYIQEGVKKAFEDAGWEVVLNDTYAYNNTEFGSQLAKIRAEEPAVIMGQLTSNDSSVAFMNQFLANPTNSLVYIQWSPASPEFINLLGDKANGVMWQTLINILPENKESFYPMFEADYGREPGANAPQVWDDFYMWKTAVESCGSYTDHDCVIKYFDEMDSHPYEGICGTYGFDPETNKGRSGDEWAPMQFIQIQDQKNVTLFLGTQPQENTAFQIPPWIEQ